MRARLRGPRGPYFEDDFFDELLDDLRAEDFEAFFAPPLLDERDDALDFLAPDLEAPERDLDEDFLLVAGDLAIADVLSFPF